LLIVEGRDNCSDKSGRVPLHVRRRGTGFLSKRAPATKPEIGREGGFDADFSPSWALDGRFDAVTGSLTGSDCQ